MEVIKSHELLPLYYEPLKWDFMFVIFFDLKVNPLELEKNLSVKSIGFFS